MIDDRAKPGDRLSIRADTWNQILRATEAFNAGQPINSRGKGYGLNVELLWIDAAASGSGNYTARQALSYKGGFPKVCSDPNSIGTWAASATCTFVNLPEVFDADSHFLTEASVGDVLALGVQLSTDTDNKPVFFGIGFRTTSCTA